MLIYFVFRINDIVAVIVCFRKIRPAVWSSSTSQGPPSVLRHINAMLLIFSHSSLSYRIIFVYSRNKADRQGLRWKSLLENLTTLHFAFYNRRYTVRGVLSSKSSPRQAQRVQKAAFVSTFILYYETDQCITRLSNFDVVLIILYYWCVSNQAKLLNFFPFWRCIFSRHACQLRSSDLHLPSCWMS